MPILIGAYLFYYTFLTGPAMHVAHVHLERGVSFLYTVFSGDLLYVPKFLSVLYVFR